MKLYSVTLPLPPSVNGLYPGKARRYPSPEYKAWMREAGLILRHAPKIPDPVQINYTVYFRDKRSGDLSNRLKATEDLLVKRKVIVDDSHIWLPRFEMRLGGYDKFNPRIHLEIHTLGQGK